MRYALAPLSFIRSNCNYFQWLAGAIFSGTIALFPLTAIAQFSITNDQDFLIADLTGDCYGYDGNPQLSISAIQACSQLVTQNSNDVEAYFNRGRAYTDSGNLQAAIADYNQAIQLQPDLASEAHSNIGLAHYKAGDLRVAIANFNQAIQLDPNFAYAYYNRGLARYDAGDLQGSIADLQQSANLFQAQGNNQDYQDAIAMLRLILR